MSSSSPRLKIHFSSEAVDQVPTGLQPMAWEDAPEGQLTMDVYQNSREVIVLAPMAGARMATIDVSIHHDLLTIRGERRVPVNLAGYESLYAECFWGAFSRTIVLPAAVNADRARASSDGGVLVIRIPKRGEHAQIPIHIVEQ